MIVKIEKIVNVHEALNKLASLNLCELNLDLGIIRKIINLQKKVQEEFKIWDRYHNDLVVQLGQPIKEIPGQFKFEGKNSIEYAKKRKEALLKEIEIDFKKICLKMDIKKLQLSMNDLIALEDFMQIE